MRRLLVSLTVLALLLIPGAPAWGDRSDEWHNRAVDAIDRFEAADSGDENAWLYAYMAEAVARSSQAGWSDPKVAGYLAKVYARANPDGGYGLGVSYDAFADGTTNPASTTYTVSLAGHVGPVLLAGYRAGVVPAGKVETVISLILSTPRLDTAAGRCWAYSRHSNDAKAGLCVHNVNAGAAAFLLDAGADFPSAASWWLIAGATKRELSVYNASTKWWPYRDTSALGDPDHNSYEAESMYTLAYPVGYSAAYTHMVNSYSEATAPIAHMRLTSLPAQPTAMSGAASLWCVLGDQWLGEFDAFVTAQAGSPTRMAQAAYYAARNADAC